MTEKRELFRKIKDDDVFCHCSVCRDKRRKPIYHISAKEFCCECGGYIDLCEKCFEALKDSINNGSETRKPQGE